MTARHFLGKSQEESKEHVRRDSTGSLVSPGSLGYEYDASVEGSAGEVWKPSSRPRGASVSPCSIRSSSFDGSDSAEREACLRRSPQVDYIVPTWNFVGATGPPSVDTGYAASAGGRTRASSEDSTSRSSESSLLNPGGAPSRGVKPSTTSNVPTYRGLSKSSSESDLRKPPWSVAPASVGNLSRSRSESSVNRMMACPLKSVASSAPSASSGHSGASCRLLSARTSASDEDGSVYNVTRPSRESLEDSTELSWHTSASDRPASAEISSMLPRSSRSSSSRTWNPPESEPDNISSSGPKGNNSVDPVVYPMPKSMRGTMSLDSRRTPHCPGFTLAMVRQDSLCESGSFGRCHPLPLGSLVLSSTTPRTQQPGEGRHFTANKSTTEKISLDERPPFSGSSLAGSPPASGHSNQIRRSLFSLEASASLGADANDNGQASFLTQPPRETSLALPGMEDFTLGLQSAGVASTRSVDSLETKRFSQAWISAASSPAPCHGRRSSGRDSASWGSFSSCGGGSSPHSRSRVSFALSVSATPWVCLADHDELPSSVESSSPIGCRIVCPPHQGQAVDKPPRLVQENPLPDDGQTRSTIGNEAGKGLCPDAAPSTLLKQGVTNMVSTQHEYLPSPDAARSPVFEQDITDMASTLRQEFMLPAEHWRIERVGRRVELAAPPSTSEVQVLDGDVLASRSDDPPGDSLTDDCAVVATPGNSRIESADVLSSPSFSVAEVSDNVVLSPRVRSREESGRGLRPASGNSNQVRRSLLLLDESSPLGADSFNNERASFLTQPPRETSLTLSGMEDFTLGLPSEGVVSTRSADSLETERFSQAWISAASSLTSRHGRCNSGRDGASWESFSSRGGGGSPRSSPRVSFALSVSATPWHCLADHDELPSSEGGSSRIGCRIICASNGQATDKTSRLVQESSVPGDGPARSTIEPAGATIEPASSTIGNEEGKCPCPDAAPSPGLKQDITDMVSTPQEDLRSPGAVRSPVLEQDITDVVSTPRKGFSLPAKFMRVERVGRSVEMVAPPSTSEVQVINDGVSTLRSDDPSGDLSTNDCSAVATSGNSGIESAGVLSSSSLSVVEVADNVVSSPRVRSREEGGRGLRFGDSPILSQRGSSDSSWSLTKYVASGKADASHDDSDSSWSLTKNIASGEIVASAGKAPDATSPVSSDLSYRVTLEHGPQPTIEDSVGSAEGSDACSAPTRASHTSNSAIEGRDGRIIPESPMPLNYNSGSSDGMGSARGGDADQGGRSGRIAGVPSSFRSNMQESTREVIHVTTRATPNIARNTPICARLHSGYPPSVRERRTIPQRKSSSSIQRSSSKSGCSDVSIRQRSSSSFSARRTSSTSSGRNGCGNTTFNNVLPSTDEAAKKVITRGRMEREPSSSFRSLSTPSARTKARGETGSTCSKHDGGVPPVVSSCGVDRPPRTARSKSISIVQNLTPTLAAVTLRPSQPRASSAASSSTASGRLRIGGQRGGEPRKSTPVLRASPANLDLANSSSDQRNTRAPTEASTAPRPSEVQRCSRASRLASCASADEPRSRDITKSKSIPRRSSIEVKTTKTSRSRSLAIQGRLSAAAAPPIHSRVRAHRSSCPSTSTSAVGKFNEEQNRLRESTGQSRTVAPSQRSGKNVFQTPVFLSSACASTAGSVAAVSPESVRTSISGRRGVDGGGRQGRENNTSRCSSGGGSATVSENPGERGAGITRNSSRAPRRRTATSDESKCQERRFRGDSACDSGEIIGGGDGRRAKHGRVEFNNSRLKDVGVGNEDAPGELSSISSDHRTSSSATEHSDADEDSAAASAPSVPPSRASDQASDRTPVRETAALDAPYAKLARLRAENARNGRTHEKLKLELLPRLKRMMKEWKPGAYSNPQFNKKTSLGGRQSCRGVLESKDDAQSVQSAAANVCREDSESELAVNCELAAGLEAADLKERLRQSEEARAADSTPFKTRMSVVNAQLAFSEAARAEEQKSSAQRTSLSNAKTDHAISELAAAKKSWADERQKMTTTMLNLKQDAAECKERLVSTEKATARQQVAADERASAAKTKTAGLEAKDICPKEDLTESKHAEYTSFPSESKVKEAHKAMIRLRGVLTEKVALAAHREAALTECKARLVSAEAKAAGLEANIVSLEEDLKEAKTVEHASLAREFTLQKKVAGLRDLLAENMASEVDREAAFTECKERLVSAEKAMARKQVEADKRSAAVETKTAGLEAKDVCPREDLTESKHAEHTSNSGESKVKEAHKAMIRLHGVLTEKVALAAHREAALKECKARLVSAEETMAMQQVEADERQSAAKSKAAGLEAKITCLEEDLTDSKHAEHSSLSRESTLQKEVAGLQNVLAEKRALEAHRKAAFTECKKRLVSAEESMVMHQAASDKRESAAKTKAACLEADIARLEEDLTESKHAEHSSLARESTLQKEMAGLRDVLAEKRTLGVDREFAFTECKERLISAEESMVKHWAATDEREIAAETKAAGLEAKIACLEEELVESKCAEHTSLARESIVQKEVAELRDVLAEKRALEVDREAAFTKCKESLVSAEESMVMHQMASDERESAQAKATGLEANIVGLEQELIESKRAEYASLARESTLQKDMARLRAEKRALEVDREAVFTRERGLQEMVNDANERLVAERGARDAERATSLQHHVKLKGEASTLKLREFSARKAMISMKEETEMSALAGKAAVSELENSLVKSKRSLLAEQVAASARYSAVKKEHASQLRDVRKRLMLCEAARKEEQEEAALTLSISEEKVTQTVEQLVIAEDALRAERNEMTTRFATLQRESVNNFEKRERSAEEKMKALKVMAHQREARLEAEMTSMRERLAVAEGRFKSEHAENTRLFSRLQALGQETARLTQRLVEVGETLETQRTKATEDLRVVHEELGKLQTTAEKENKQNTALVARFTELELFQSDKLETLTFEAATLVKERDTANGLLKDQEIACAKERTMAARENSALKKVLNDLGKLELAEQRSLQVDKSATPGCDSSVTIDGDHGRRGTAKVWVEGTSQFAVKNTGLGNSIVGNHAMTPQRPAASCRKRIAFEQDPPPDKFFCSAKQDSVIEEESSLPTGAGYEPFRGKRLVRTRREAPSATVSSARTIDPGTTSVENHAMASLRSSTSRREMIYPEQGLPPDKHVRDTKQDPAIKKDSFLSTDAEYGPFQGTKSACARGESSPTTISAVRSADPGTRSVRDYAMVPQRLSASHLEMICLDRGLSPGEYTRNAKKAPKEESGLATGAKYEPSQRARSACPGGGSLSASISSVASTDPGTRSVENQVMVSQRSSASRLELIHHERSLLPDNFSRDIEQVPPIEDEAGLATVCTRDESSSASVSSVRSTDLGTCSAGSHGMAPQPSSASRRERSYLYLNQNLLPAKGARNAEKVPTIMEESDLETGAGYGPFQRTRSVGPKGGSSSARVSSSLVSGTGLHITPATTKILRASVLPEEVRLGQERDRADSCTRQLPLRSKALSCLNDRWLEEEPAEAPESAEAETTIRHERCTGSRRTVGTGVLSADGHASFSQQGKYVIDIDRFQDTGSMEGSCTLAPQNPNHRARNGREKPINSTMQEVSGWLEAVVEEAPASAREQGREWFDAGELRPRWQRETSFLASQILNERAERSRTITDNGSLRDGVASRCEHIASAFDPYIPRKSTRREPRGETSTLRDANEHEDSPGGTSSSRSIQRRHHHHQPASRSLCFTLVSRAPSSQSGYVTSTMRSSRFSRQLEVSRPASFIGQPSSSSQADRLECGVQSQRDQSPHPRLRSGTDMQKMRGFLSGMHASTKAVEEFAENLELSTFSRSRRRTKKNTRK